MDIVQFFFQLHSSSFNKLKSKFSKFPRKILQSLFYKTLISTRINQRQYWFSYISVIKSWCLSSFIRREYEITPMKIEILWNSFKKSTSKGEKKEGNLWAIQNAKARAERDRLWKFIKCIFSSFSSPSILVVGWLSFRYFLFHFSPPRRAKRGFCLFRYFCYQFYKIEINKLRLKDLEETTLIMYKNRPFFIFFVPDFSSKRDTILRAICSILFAFCLPCSGRSFIRSLFMLHERVSFL